VILLGLLGPYFTSVSPDAFVGMVFASPNRSMPLGTDYLGRDVLARVLAGGQTVVILGVLAAAVAIVVGTIVGLVAAQGSTWLDETLMRSSDIFLAFPQMILALLFVSVLGSHLWLIVSVVGLSAAPQIARIVRAAALTVLNQDYIAAARLQGESTVEILFRHVVPNIAAPLRVQAGLRVTYSVQIIACLSFLGFGVLPPQADWGLMIGENRLGLTENPWSVLVPVFLIAALTVGLSLLSEGGSRRIAAQLETTTV
jgi:peptide/nickel transport system permease protein